MNIRCLVVDDDALIRGLIRLSLTAAGFEVVAEATTRAEAVAAATSTEPELVLIDLVLSNGDDGLPAITELRAILPDAPIVVLSGLPAVEMEAPCLQAGADYYLEKRALVDLGEVLTGLLSAGTR